MTKRFFFPVFMGICTNLIPILLPAQNEKFLRPVTVDSAIVSLSKKDIQQLDAVPATARRLIITGTTGLRRQASLLWLGRKWQKKVTRVDLSAVVSKYIGETEKNLDLIFRDVDRNGSILLFEEADALFGNRTHVKDAHDKYANQEVSYLMNHIEKFEGIVALSFNKNGNIDSAFLKKFHLIKTE